MDAIKFLKIDMRITKSQFKTLLLFAALALFLSIKIEMSTFAFSYMCFGFMVISSVPFSMSLEGSSQAGFYLMLPAGTMSRVVGRYLYYLVMIAMAALTGIAIMVLSQVVGGKEMAQTGILVVLNLSMAIIIGAIQYVLYYKFGSVKGQLATMILRLAPTFLFFFGMQFVIEKFSGNEGNLPAVFLWVAGHTGLACAALIAVSMLIFIACIFISARICERQDV